MTTLLVTGSNGLIGSEVSRHFHARGWTVHGVDNNLRMELFGPGGDTRPMRAALEATCDRYTHHELDVRDRPGVAALIDATRPAAIVHCAAQPSHDLAARKPFVDFDVNAVGTLNLLEAARRRVPASPFVLMSTNKVYGDAPNELPLRELPTRWDYARPEDAAGIDETLRIDRCMHSLFGASKVAADVLAQEYGRYFDMPVGVFRGGCLTGAAHAGVELHGFLSYLTKVAVRGGRYTVFGYDGKQVRDNIHAQDVATAIAAFIAAPRAGEVYNLGGGRANSVSIREAFAAIERRTGRTVDFDIVDAPRAGDHICYISNMARFRSHYPAWTLARDLDAIFDELVDHEQRALP